LQDMFVADMGKDETLWRKSDELPKCNVILALKPDLIKTSPLRFSDTDLCIDMNFQEF